MFGLAALADPVINILLTEEWLPTIPLLRVIAITEAMFPILLFNMNILWVKKRSDLTLRLESINIIFRLGIVFALYKTGILWVCIALCIANFLSCLVYAKVVEKECTYGLLKQLKDLAYIFFAAIASSFAAYNLVLPNFENNVIRIVLGTIVIAVIYAVLLLMKGGYEVKLLLSVIKKKQTRE